jgi:hypothetical protein
MPVSTPLPVFPLINGNRFDFTSIEIMINGVPYRGVKAIDYEDQLDPKKSYGTSARPLGRNRGPYDASGSLEIFREDWNSIAPVLAALGNGGIGEANFLVIAHYADFGAPTITDTLIGCRVKKITNSHAQGASELTVKLELDIMDINRNGLSLLSPAATLK